MKFSTTSIVALLAITADAHSFSKSCRRIRLDWGLGKNPPQTNWLTLSAECKMADGDRRLSSLDLNPLMSNHNGSLYWDRSGGFTETCTTCMLTRKPTARQQVMMACFCETLDDLKDAPVSMTYVNLDKVVSNHDGYLVADDIIPTFGKNQ